MHEIPVPQETRENDWQTMAREEISSLTEFLSKYLQQPIENRQRYNPLTELHFSGLNDIFDEIKDGAASVISATKFFSNGSITQIHIIFDSRGSGHNTDTYLQGKALQDFLTFHSDRNKECQ